MRYVTRSVVVEAFQMTWFRKMHPSTWPEWLRNSDDVTSRGPGNVTISTLGGRLRVSANNWVIKGVKGELYLCKPGVFDMTYEPVDDSPATGGEGE